MATEHARGPVTRPAAGTCVGAMVAAATVTILMTRLYLFVTGYPQVGGKIFHIAHSVWGGLLLMTGLFLAMAIANRWGSLLGGVLGGIGAGLFIDEIGKFITKDNDYFFPLAAPLAYGVLVAFGAAAYWAGSATRGTARSHLYAALELTRPTLDRPMALTRRQMDSIRRHLDAARDLSDDTRHQPLIEGLSRTLDQAESESSEQPSTVRRLVEHVESWEERLFPTERTRKICRGGLTVLGILGVIGGPAAFAVALWRLLGPASLHTNSLLGDRPGGVAWTAAAVAAVTGLAAGVFAWMGVRRLGPRSDDLHAGLRWGLTSLALLLVGVNFVSSYFDQFLVLLDGSALAGLFGVLVRFGRRTGTLHRR